jgi:bis(5'-nucleosyl)-tetraphosphatase (symmetrical)
MRHFAIGDVQGCYDTLLHLLDHIQYTEADELWFVGDLINRGKKSLETLRFIKTLPRKKIVLGNHEIHFLAVAQAGMPSKEHDTFHDILKAQDKEDLIHWLSQQKLFYHDPLLNFSMVHAGLIPQWSIAQALDFSREVECVLQGADQGDFYKSLYGYTMNQWSDNLTGISRLRFIVDCFTRIRFCSAQGVLDLKSKKGLGTQMSGFMPWFDQPYRQSANDNIVFGHWAALEGQCDAPHAYAIDTGCVWGRDLTALDLKTLQRFSVKFVA